MLSRTIGYLIQSVDRLLTGSLNMKPDELFVEACCDADFAGEVDDMYSTSGGWIQLTDESGQFFPLAWLSKKQMAVSRSTTEAGVVALSYVLFDNRPRGTILSRARQKGNAQAQRRLRSLCQAGICRILEKA